MVTKGLHVHKVVLLFSVLAVLAGYSPVHAYEPNKIPSIYGVGSVSCGDLVAARQENDANRISRFRQWAYGYFTAVSMYYPPANNKHFLETSNHDSVMSWLESYCRKNPAANLHDAVKSLQNDVIQAGKRK